MPRKNLRMVGGHPMVAWTIRAAIESGVCDGVWVSTDDEEIGEVAKRYGAFVHWREDPALSADDAPTWLVVKAFMDELCEFDAGWSELLILQPTSPLRWVEPIREAASKLQSSTELRIDDRAINDCPPEAGYVVSVTRNPLAYFSGELDGWQWNPTYWTRPRTQDNGVHTENGAVFGCTRIAFEDLGDYFSYCDTHAITMDPCESVDVDSEWELEVADWMAWRHQLRRNPRIKWPVER